MPWANLALFQHTLLWTSVAAALLAVLFLAFEFWASRIWARRAPAIATLILAATAVIVWLMEGWARLGAACGILAGFYLVAWSASLESVREQVSKLLTPKVLWVVVLLASVAASQLLGSQLLRSIRDVTVPETIEFGDSPVVEVQALTDRGRLIPLFHFEMSTPPETVEAAVLAAADYQHKVIRLVGPSNACNCHGWVFTGGKYGIRNPDVPTILADNEYAIVQAPREGDLAIYQNGEQFTHSGRVRLTQSGGSVLVESKWGPFGVFLHAPDAQPFSGVCTFYRSARTGHALSLRSAAQTEAQAATRASPPDRF